MRAGSAWLRLGCRWICCDLTEIGGCLEAFVVKNGLGETYAAGTGFIIDTAPDTVRAPDDICILTEGDMLDGGDVVPGWKMALADVF